MHNGKSKEEEAPSLPSHTTRLVRRRAIRIASTAGLALGLSAGVAAAAGASTAGTTTAHSAASGQHHAHGTTANGGSAAAVGTVASVGTDSFTLTTKAGATVTVDVTSSTSYKDQGVTSPSLADVTVGETVAAFGTESSGTVTATSVSIGVTSVSGAPSTAG
jgi:hypothetical protein